MIAFIGERPKRCDSCGAGPCHDGTACSGAHRFRNIEMEIVVRPMPAHRSHMDDVRVTDDIERHPRYFNQAPRSPRPGFRKR